MLKGRLLRIGYYAALSNSRSEASGSFEWSPPTCEERISFETPAGHFTDGSGHPAGAQPRRLGLLNEPAGAARPYASLSRGCRPDQHISVTVPSPPHRCHVP